MPRDWYENDNPKLSKPSKTVKAKLERKRPRGNIKYRRQDTIMAQVEESTARTLAQIRENADFRKLVSKYKNEAKKLIRLGQAFPEPGSRFYDDL